MVLRVTFFRDAAPAEPIGECELYLVWHCTGKSFAATEAVGECCDKRARETFIMEDGRNMAKIRGC